MFGDLGRVGAGSTREYHPAVEPAGGSGAWNIGSTLQGGVALQRPGKKRGAQLFRVSCAGSGFGARWRWEKFFFGGIFFFFLSSFFPFFSFSLFLLFPPLFHLPGCAARCLSGEVTRESR